jgi:hypothetical protein
MFKGFQDTSRGPMFRGFPNLNFQSNNAAYGFGNLAFWLNPSQGLSSTVNGAQISNWQESINRINFLQGTSANQPLLISSDINFNNHPTLDFSLGTRCLTADRTLFFNQGNTLVIVYRATNLKFQQDAHYRIVGSGLQTYTRSNGNTGYCVGGILDFSASNGAGIFSSWAPQSLYSTSLWTTNRYIVVITNTSLIANGSVIDTGSITGFNLQHLGGTSGNGGSSANFILADLLMYSQSFNDNDAIQLCNNINQKYLIY